MSWEGKRVLITGAGGFAGSYLARYLIDNGAEVYGILRRRADWSIPQNIVDRGIHEKVQLLEADLQDISSLASALDRSQPDVIFHLAAQSFVPQSFVNPIETMQINCMGTANLLEAVRIKNYDPAIVFAGLAVQKGHLRLAYWNFSRLWSSSCTFSGGTAKPLYLAYFRTSTVVSSSSESFIYPPMISSKKGGV